MDREQGVRRPITGARAGIFAASVLLFACSGAGPSSNLEKQMAYEMMPMASVGSVAYHQSGETGGQVVVFVHGTPGSASAWDEYLREVPRGFQFLAYDRPGFGKSPKEEVYPSLREQAEAIALFLPKDGRKAILVGHSLGGPIIAKAAAMYPDKVSGLVIVAGSLDPGLEKINPLQHLGKWWPISRILPKELYNSNLELFALKEELEDLERELPGINLPIHIIHGTKDRLVPYANVAFMKESMTQAALEIVTLQDQNHFLPWNSKQVIDDAIVAIAEISRESL
jgi:pimeloyl-ACP methyl ester carboxylesterase